jgi:hypothetical protein
VRKKLRGEAYSWGFRGVLGLDGGNFPISYTSTIVVFRVFEGNFPTVHLSGAGAAQNVARGGCCWRASGRGIVLVWQRGEAGLLVIGRAWCRPLFRTGLRGWASRDRRPDVRDQEADGERSLSLHLGNMRHALDRASDPTVTSLRGAPPSGVISRGDVVLSCLGNA